MREQGSSNPEAHRQVPYWTSPPLTSLGLVGIAQTSGEITSPAPPPDEQPASEGAHLAAQESDQKADVPPPRWRQVADAISAIIKQQQ